jgi:ATP-dependent protease ClpP protease subunit
VTTRTRRRSPRASRGLPSPADVGRAVAEQIRAYEDRQTPGWYHISPVYALAGDATEQPANSADVYVYDVIGGWWGMTADDFVRDVASLDVDQIVLHLNSPGGDASEGVAIANVLRAHRAQVVVRVDGWAASAGSVIAMAGDEIVMGIGAQMMIHDAWGYASGNAAEMRKAAEMLDSTSNALASTYAARTGGSTADWRAVMEEESWYTAEEAVAAGLADRVATADETGTSEGQQITPGARSGSFWDLWDSAGDPNRWAGAELPYAYAGRQNAPAPRIPARTAPAAAAAGSPITETQERSPAVAFSPEQLTTMRQRLGLADDADEATILAAFETRIDDPAPQPTTPPANAPGTVTLDEAQHAELLAAARDGREARAQQLAERRASLVQAAIDDGRIPPARRGKWLAYLEADPEGETELAKLEKGLVPITEIGYASKDTPADPAAADDYWFAGVGGPAKTEG